MVFVLGSHMVKLSRALASQITTLLGEVGVEVKPIYHHALKVTHVTDIASLDTDTSTPVVDESLTNFELDGFNDQDDSLSIM